MVISTRIVTPPRFRFREGMLDQIAAEQNLSNDNQVANMLGFTIEQVEGLRHGQLFVNAASAQLITALMGSRRYIGKYFEPDLFDTMT